jgi:hypothetical protein
MNPLPENPVDFIAKENIEKLLNSLLLSVIRDLPDNPRAYIFDKLSQVRQSQQVDQDIPCDQVLTDEEISAIFRSIDIEGCGSMNSSDARRVLRSLSPVSEHGNIEKILIPPYVSESVFSQLLRTVLKL